jgi:radical SAM superfamily enzyme YgiQ (UPF0313 family)
MSKVVLVNPANASVGYSVITPRWLFVIAGATPTDLVGDPIVVDEPIEPFDPDLVGPGDIVGVGIHTGNCRPGYRVVREAKRRGATVIVGGVHGTIFPNEPLEMGADCVVTGSGDLVWRQVVEDALSGRLKKLYGGGRVEGEQMVKPRWDLMKPDRYLMGSIQTVAGCPENCNFCSVWVTDGRRPRLHMRDQIIEEANELYRLGFRYIFFADDNFSPSSLGRIARETSPTTRALLERVREERLQLFNEYDEAVPRTIFGLTQMTAEVVEDEEYLRAAHDKMRLRGALVGVESFSEEGLKTANKTWNPVGQKMVEAIHKLQDHGILVLASIIYGLENDSVATLRTMRKFAEDSGAALAQFPFFSVYPGTKDYHEMMRDWKNRDRADYKPKHAVQITRDRFWLDYDHTQISVRHPTIQTADLVREVHESWRCYYKLSAIIARTRTGALSRLSFTGKLAYIVSCIGFWSLYPDGIAADNVRKKKLGFVGRISLKIWIALVRASRDWLSIGPELSKPRTTTA